jgi:adenylate cyclase
MNSIIRRPDFWIVALLFFLMIPAERLELFSQVENQLQGIRHIFRNSTLPIEETQFPYDQILIVDTEEQFFEEYGSWPLRRADIAQIVVNLRKLGAKVIALDMLMDFPNGYGEDPILAEALSAGEEGLQDTMVVAQLDLKGSELQKINGATDVLAEATQMGYTNHTLIGSMLSRVRFYPEIQAEHQIWPFAVQALAMSLDVKPQLEGNELVVGPYRVPLDHNNDLWIDFPSLPPHTNFLSKNTPAAITAAMVLMDLEDIPEEEFEEETEDLRPLVENKIVLVGDTSEVSHDIFETPIGEVYGIEILADTINTIINNGPIQPASEGMEIAVLLILLVLFILAAQAHHFSTPLFFLITLGYVGVAFYAYIYHGVAFSMSYALLACILSIFAINLYQFLLERRQKSFIKGAFSQYLSPAVIDVIVDDPSKLKLGGERREMTAYFSDVQKFSTISEKLTPEELVQLLNEYLTAMCDIISSHNGTIDKFEGDAIIAFWGAPLEQPDHAKLACFATIDMQKTLMEMRKGWKAQGRDQLYARMGVNSGPIVVGNMGSAQRMDYTMMGDAVNLAARLEGANKFYKNYTMVSGDTYKLVESDVDARMLDIIRVVGRKDAVPVYEVLERKNQTTGPLAGAVEAYSQGLKVYQEADFKAAVQHFEKALSILPEDGPSQVMLQRCQQYIEDPSGWDVVYTLTEKG